MNYYLQVLEQSEEEEFFLPYLAELEQKTSKKIDIVIDDTINTAAKIEIAKYKGKENHTIRYKKTANGYAHLVLHELTHLELIHEARQEKENYLFTSTHANESNFYKKTEKDKKRIIKGGVPPENLKPFLNFMFTGINLQIYNAPIDLFLPVLEAAHIKAYAESGPHHISNGVFMRADLHKLFDAGYMTITKDYRVEI